MRLFEGWGPRVWILDKLAWLMRMDIRINGVHFGYVNWDVEEEGSGD